MSAGPADLARDLFRAGRFAEALKLLDTAVTAAPEREDLWSNRGAVLASLQRYGDAIASFDRALALSPGSPGLHRNRANALLAFGRHEDAAQDYEKALAAHAPPLPYLRGNFLHCRLQCCDWRDFAEERARLVAEVHAGARAASPLAVTAILDDPGDQLRAARILAAGYPPFSPLWRGETYAHHRIRVAYVSADFTAHATATLMAGVFEQHDRARFETIAISFGRNDRSTMRARLERAFDRFIDVTDRSDSDIAALIRGLETDIAIDLKGYTSNARPAIFAQRPAPVQAAYLGYPGTMGADFIDYLIADRCVIPENAQRHYREKIVCLPDTYQCNDATRAIAETAPSREAEGLPSSGFAFCCFNNSYKIFPAVFGIWMDILRAIDGSVLWLLEDNSAATRNLKREAQARGIDENRLVFAARVTPEEHLARHRLADLFLDTLPYNAHTTASDALWAGIPVVTCIGNTFAGRVAASLLRATGLAELVTETLEDYRAQAVRLAREPDTLSALKRKLERNRATSPLFDTARFTRHLETAYVTMHERGKHGLAPAGFTVNPNPRQG